MAEVILLRAAEADLVEIYSALFEKNPDLAEAFSVSVDRAISDLDKHPSIGAVFEGSFRRKLLPRFYQYGVFYIEEGHRIVIHAILNLSQDPDHISRRLGM